MYMNKSARLPKKAPCETACPAEQEIRIALDEVLQEKHMTRYQLSKLTSINYQTIDNYYKNRVDRYDSALLLKMCRVLNCDVGTLVRMTNWEHEQKKG